MLVLIFLLKNQSTAHSRHGVRNDRQKDNKYENLVYLKLKMNDRLVHVSSKK